MDVQPFIPLHSPSEGHFGCFPFLAISNKAAMMIHVQVFGHKCSTKFLSPCPFFYQIFFFVLSYRSFLHILEINSFSDRWFSNIFSCSVDDFFTPVAVSFATRNSLLCTYTCLFCLLLTALLVFYVQKDHCQNQCQRSFSLMCCSRSSTFSGLMWKSLIHFELTLVYGIRWGLISFHFFLLVCG